MIRNCTLSIDYLAQPTRTYSACLATIKMVEVMITIDETVFLSMVKDSNKVCITDELSQTKIGIGKKIIN